MNLQMSRTASPSLQQVLLDDKYLRTGGSIMLNGPQALVRLMLDQSREDRAAGLNTSGFVSGYRGSPLGGVDQAFWKAAEHLETAVVHFEPGLNEDLAATAVWGTQQTGLLGSGGPDGVFGLWYGKNPGVDRCGDVLKHANISGTSRNGGVVAVSGDDPGATSSSIPNQCEQSFAAAMMPVLYPANIADILEFGRFGFAMSRYSGLWAAMKTVADTIETTATVDLVALARQFVEPENATPRNDVITRWPDDRWSQDRRLQEIKLPAAIEYAAANGIDRLVLGNAAPQKPARRFGIITAGKASLDVLEALASIGIDDVVAAQIGLSVYKVGMVWPLEPTGLRRFAEGLEKIFVVEERRSFLESQLKEIAYHWPADKRPEILGKTDRSGKPLFPSIGETSPQLVAEIIGKYLLKDTDRPEIAAGMGALTVRKDAILQPAAIAVRIPHFCAGCPHSRSTELTQGSTALAGIGCHSLAIWMDAGDTRLLTQMGGEGANWIGAHRYVDKPHVFQNLGDGTYTHSGLLAIRAAVAAKVPITYKILYNDAVAMTGGQPLEGALGVGDIARQMQAEKVGKVVVVSSEPEGLRSHDLPAGVPLHHRDELAGIMEDCRKWPGVSVIIYDQLCATEKRRRIRKGSLPQPKKRVVINQRICEGCGDCSAKSGCVAIEPVETFFGVKRRINQSVCNTDLSCLDGFCPAMVTVEGGEVRKPEVAAGGIEWEGELPEPAQPEIEETWNILIAGVGGTGLITIGAIIGMAVHLEGGHCTILDNTGLARKGGAVTTHLRISASNNPLSAPRIGIGKCDLLLAGDPVVAAGSEVISRLATGSSRGIINTHAIPTASQARKSGSTFDTTSLLNVVERAAGDCMTVNASELAKALIGSDIYTNMILLGAAFQEGQIPVSADALKRSIELNGIAVEENLRAFAWGRRYASDCDAVRALAGLNGGTKTMSIDEVIDRFATELTLSRNNMAADEFTRVLRALAALEGNAAGKPDSISRTVAQIYYKLLASKDEFEVARLMCDEEFQQQLDAEFKNYRQIKYHFASPMLGMKSRQLKRGYKKSLGFWFRPVLGALARLRPIRNTIADPFRYQQERRLERQLVTSYTDDIKCICKAIQKDEADLARELAIWPDGVRGFGPVKEKNARAALQNREAALSQLQKTGGIGG